jgi:hypothetical protein
MVSAWWINEILASNGMLTALSAKDSDEVLE